MSTVLILPTFIITMMVVVLAYIARRPEQWAEFNNAFVERLPEVLRDSQPLRNSDISFFALCGIVILTLMEIGLIVVAVWY